jgi:ferritin
MIKQKVESALNEQMKKEFYSSYLYLAMAAHFESLNFKGFAHWMRMQSQEEYVHAMKIFQHLTERGGKVVLQQIDTPPSKWDSPKEVFEDAYQHEQKVTQSISDLVELSKAEKDHPTEIFLHWFVREQVEEEASAYEIVQKLQLVGNEGGALFMLDGELGKRAPSKE